MDAAEPLLRPLTGIVNRRIRTSTAALDLCRELAGRQIAIRVRDTAIAVTARVEPDGLRPGPMTGEADVVIEGSPLALAALGGDDPMEPIRDGRVSIAGDSDVATRFQRLIELAKPDPGEAAAELFGDRAAAALGGVVRQAADWGKDALRTVGDRIGERVVAGSDTPKRDEYDAFAADVRALRDRTARLAARLEAVAGRSRKD